MISYNMFNNERVECGCMLKHINECVFGYNEYYQRFCIHPFHFKISDIKSITKLIKYKHNLVCSGNFLKAK